MLYLLNGLTHQADPPTILGCSPLNLARDPASDDSMLEARGRSDSRSIPLKRYAPPLSWIYCNIHMSDIVYPTIMKRVGFVSARSLASRTCTIKSSCQFQVVRFFFVLRLLFRSPFVERSRPNRGVAERRRIGSQNQFEMGHQKGYRP